MSVSLFCCRLSISHITLTFLPSFVPPCDRRTSTHRPFCRLLCFAFCVVFHFVVCPIQAPQWNLSTRYHSMILFNFPLVIPTRIQVVLLFPHTIFSILGQVCYPASAYLSRRLTISDPQRHFWRSVFNMKQQGAPLLDFIPQYVLCAYFIQRASSVLRYRSFSLLFSSSPFFIPRLRPSPSWGRR